jgi:hypothetical protein
MSKCISCGQVEVTWPLVCDACQDHEAQAALRLEGADECRSCGMLYDGGMRCTYCGDSNPADDPDLENDEEEL